MAVLLDGRSVAAKIYEELGPRVAELSQKLGRPPAVAILCVGNNPPSQFYVRRKCAVAETLGIHARVKQFPQSVAEERVLDQISTWNGDETIDGIQVKAPLPSTKFQEMAFSTVDPAKDIDGFHPSNAGLLALDSPGGFIPCTPKGIVRLLSHYGVNFHGQHAVVLGRSSIVGRPLSLLLQSRSINATVTTCHSQSRNFGIFSRSADILVSAVGHPNLIRGDQVKEGAIVVDVGQNWAVNPNNPLDRKLCGDIDFISVVPHCSFITPVPGGVGPMTVAMAMENILEAAVRKIWTRHS
jgi:methylenetetrahydrofolate dehydrogenase (NADP+)/methenyltetrahydrofolate cyclohydrolase